MSKAYSVFATHYNRLVQLEMMYPTCKCCHLEADCSNGHIKYTYTLKDGYCTQAFHYGISMAEKVFPPEVVDDARSLCSALDALDSATFEVDLGPHLRVSCLTPDEYVVTVVVAQEAMQNHKQTRQQIQLLQRLQCLRYASDLSEDSIREYLKYLKVWPATAPAMGLWRTAWGHAHQSLALPTALVLRYWYYYSCNAMPFARRRIPEFPPETGKTACKSAQGRQTGAV
eukprot:scaffold2645_cov378-Prasinococcus_capsulatus_cf.AAC.26